MEREPTFAEAFSPDNLRSLWQRIQNNHFDLYRGRPIIQTGSDGIQYSHFQRDLEKHISASHRKVMDGRYTFAPLLEIEKTKPSSSKKRTISISSIRDTIVQTALYEFLYPRIDMFLTDAVFGYRRGRNAHGAVKRVRQHFSAGRTFIFDADFSDFFGTVRHEFMFARLAKVPYEDERAGALFRRFLKTACVSPSDVRARKEVVGKQVKYRTRPRLVGLPQGGVLSGLASNLYLADFDERIGGLHEGYVRYADDFLVCCSSEAACHEVHLKVTEHAAELGLSLNAAKTRVCVRAEDGVEFLGFRITEASLRIRGRNVASFKHRISAIINCHKPSASANVTLSKLARRLSYKICGPKRSDVDRLIEAGLVDHPYRRCWIGFFRVVTDETQIRTLDRWIRAQIARYMWRGHRVRVRYKDIRGAGLPSLISAMHKARRRYLKGEAAPRDA